MSEHDVTPTSKFFIFDSKDPAKSREGIIQHVFNPNHPLDAKSIIEQLQKKGYSIGDIATLCKVTPERIRQIASSGRGGVLATSRLLLLLEASQQELSNGEMITILLRNNWSYKGIARAIKPGEDDIRNASYDQYDLNTHISNKLADLVGKVRMTQSILDKNNQDS